eukprot:12528773-Heterocapsa_arctica.AAC.1
MYTIRRQPALTDAVNLHPDTDGYKLSLSRSPYPQGSTQGSRPGFCITQNQPTQRESPTVRTTQLRTC